MQLNDNLRLDYLKLNFSGNATINQDLNYKGTVYAANSDVASNLDMTYLRATWFRPITKSESMQTNWMIDLKGFKFDTKVNGTNQSTGLVQSENKSFQGVIPTIGFAIKANLDSQARTQAYAEISGLPLGKYGTFYDAEAGLKYAVGDNISINAGYRIFDLDVKNPSNEDNGQFKLSGPYFGIAGKF